MTRKGLPVRILATDLENKDFPIAAAIDNRYPASYTLRGRRNYELKHDDDNDLFFAPEKHEGWVNIYKDAYNNYVGQYRIFESKGAAEKDGKGCKAYIATVKIEWEE